MKKFAYIGCIGAMGVITTEFGVIGILPQIAKHYSISIDKAGILLSAFALVIALTGPFMTLLTSSFDRKKIMLLSIFIFLISGIVSSLSPPFWLLVMVRLLPAFLQPVYIATALSVAISKGNKSNENELMSIVFSGVTIAMVTTVPMATYFASIFTWEVSFLIQALVSFIAICFIYFGLPNLPVKQKKSYGSQISILQKPIFLVSTAVNFFMITAWFSTYSYFAEYLNKAKNMNDTQVSYMFFVFGILGVLSNFLAGKLMNKSVYKTILIFLTGTIIVPILLYYSGTKILSIIVIVGFWGFMYSPSFFNASTYMISSAPNAIEFANSLATSFGNLGVSIGTVMGGYVIAHYGVEYTPWLTFGFGCIAIILIGVRKLMEKKRSIAFREITDE